MDEIKKIALYIFVGLFIGFSIGSGVFAVRGVRIATELERELDTSRNALARTRAELTASLERERETARALDRSEQYGRELEQRNRAITESVEQAGTELSTAIEESRTVRELITAVRNAIDTVILADRDG